MSYCGVFLHLKWWCLVFAWFSRKDEWLCAALDCLAFVRDPPVVELCRELPRCFLLDHSGCEPSTFAEGSDAAGTCEYEKRSLSSEEKRKVFIQTRLATALPSFGPEECCIMWPFDLRWMFVRSTHSFPRQWWAAPSLPGWCGPMEAAAVRDSGETLQPGRQASAAASAHEPSLHRHHWPAGWLVF